MSRRALSFSIAALMLAACTTPTGAGTGKPISGSGKKPGATSPRPTGGPTPPAQVVAGKVDEPEAPVVPGTPAPTRTTPPVLANQVGSLVGTVRAPAALIANNGGGVISNNGGTVIANNGSGVIANNGSGIISSNGAGYRLSAVDQVPVVGATLELVDAAGNPVLVDGKPLVAVTGADGGYAFTGVLPARNLVVRFRFGDKGHALSAIAPPGAAAAQRRTDLDLVSTLATGYILEKFVKGQADAQATLDKLPPAVEAETRDATAIALAKAAPPADLAPASVVAAVDGLRQADPALDAQLEKVRALMVAAGLSNLGDGRPATEVALPAIDDVAVAADGRVFVAVSRDHRVWTIDAAGALRVALGRSPAGADADVEGKPGAEVSIDAPRALAADGDGLLVLEGKRLLRLGKDGRVAVVATGVGDARAVVARPDGPPLLFGVPLTGLVRNPETRKYERVEKAPARMWRAPATPGGAAELAHTFAPADGARIAALARAGVGPDGKVWLGLRASSGMRAQIVALDPAAPALAVVATRTTSQQALTFDRAGRVFAVERTKAALTPVVGAGTLSRGEVDGLQDFFPLAAAPDGSWVGGRSTRLWRFGASAPVPLAGLHNPPKSGRADQIGFGDLQSLAVRPDGSFLLYDEETRWLWRIDTAGNATVVLEMPEEIEPESGDYPMPNQIFTRPDGGAWLFEESSRMMRFDPPSRLSNTTLLEEGESADGVIAAADGTLYMLLGASNAQPTLRIVPVSGAPTDEELPWSVLCMGLGPDGLYFHSTDEGLVRRKPDGAFETVVDAETWAERDPGWGAYTFAIAPDGRQVGVGGDGVELLDPLTGAKKVVAGRGQEGAEASGVDDGVSGNVDVPCFDAAGNLYFLDPDYRQVKRIDAAALK